MSKPGFEAPAAAASPAVSPSRALVSAALTGLLCAATPACNSTENGERTQSMTGTTGGAGGASASGSGGASATGGDTTGGGAPNTGGNATTGGASNTGGTATTGGASSTDGGGAVTGTGGLGSDGSAQSAGETRSDAAAPSADGADGGWVFPPLGDAGLNCRMDGGLPVITSTVIATGMTLEKFTAECDARHGTVEIPPHCGGFNTCMGMSYWSETQELTEHTCKGMSSCVGYSCVVCP